MSTQTIHFQRVLSWRAMPMNSGKFDCKDNLKRSMKDSALPPVCAATIHSYLLSSLALSLRFLRPRAKAALSSRSRCSHSRSSARLGEKRMDSNRTYSYPLPLERERTLPQIVGHYI